MKSLEKIIETGKQKKAIEEKAAVLIVEDNIVNRFLAVTLIKKIIPKATIIEAQNGEEALVCINETLFDLILMDLQMPIMNGFETTTAIRKIEKYKNVPIIALTAGILDGEREKSLKFGMNDYLSKPILPNDLEQMILKWLHVKD